MRLERRTFLILLLVAGFVIRFGTVVALRDLHLRQRQTVAREQERIAC